MKNFLKRTRASLLALACAASLSVPALAAGGKATTFDNGLLALILNGTTITSLAINATSSPYTVLCLSLNTADPGVGGTQATSEAAYTSYARVSVARTSAGWTVSSNSATLTSAENFPAATGGSETETWFTLGVPTSGTTCTAASATTILYRGPITPNIAVSSGVTPQLTTGTTITEN